MAITTGVCKTIIPQNVWDFESLLYISSTMKNFWTMLWNDLTIRFFKIAKTIQSLDFVNDQKPHRYYVVVKLILFSNFLSLPITMLNSH